MRYLTITLALALFGTITFASDGVLPAPADGGIVSVLGDGTIPLRVSSLEGDVAEIKMDMKELMAYFKAYEPDPKAALMKAARRPLAKPPAKKHHYKPSTTCAPPKPCPPPKTCCSSHEINRVWNIRPSTTCSPMPMTTSSTRVVYYPRTTCSPMPMTTCSPRRGRW